MDLKLKGIRYENIREFRDLEINLSQSNGKPHHVSLVQMPNGTGKTTTMDLIRTVLLGRDLDTDEVMSYEPNEFDAIEGIFEIDLECSEEVFTLRVEFDYELGEHEYRHIKPQEVRGGDAPGHFLPSRLRNIITESFVELFVFNGELTEDFISRGKDDAEDALKTVNYLNRLEGQREEIEDIVKEREEDKKVKTEQGYKNKRTRVDSAQNRLNKLEERESQLETEIEQHSEEIEEVEEKRKELLAENEEALERDEELDTRIQELEEKIESKTDDILDEFRRPSLLDDEINEDLDELFDHMDVLKLPKSTSEEFFKELSEGEECICGREIDDEVRGNILENSEKYLSEDDIAVLNSLKDKIRNKPGYEGYEEEFEQLETWRKTLRAKRQEKNQLDLDDPDSNETLSDLVERRTTLEKEREEMETELKKLTTNDKSDYEEFGLDWKDNIPLCKKRKERLKKELREASGTVNFGKKADMLGGMFDDFVEEALEELKENQIDETNEKLKQILGLSKIQVEDIDNSIIIKGREDASEGQRLSIAYAYLATLFEDASINVPFIIDSPAVSIDYEKREEVAHMISDLFDQLVIFVISPERKKFVDELESQDIQYCTIHKTENDQVEKNTSKDYFMNFQSEEETA